MATTAQDIRRRHPKEFGPLPGLNVFDSWQNRQDCSREKVHPPIEKGIYGDKDGARSIVMSGSYEDDRDEGEEILYTGSGGRDRTGKIQIANQDLELEPNVFLKENKRNGEVVRVIRGANLNSEYAPNDGLRYDGLYEVKEANLVRGRSGFMVAQFKLQRLERQPPLPKRLPG